MMGDANDVADAGATDDPGPSAVERARHVWSIGSYASIAPNFLSMAGHLVAAADVDADDRVLDVACGTGNVDITTARRGADVTGSDVTPSMIERARDNATTAGVDFAWREGDAANLPFQDDAFDVTLSCVGHVFAEPPDETANELVRVTRSGGRIAFTSWTPSSVVSAMAKVLQGYLPPDSDPSPPPFAWGDPEVVRDRLGDGVGDVAFETGTVHHLVLSPAHYWAGAAEDSGLFIVALVGVDEADRPVLRDEMTDTIGGFFDDHENAVRMEYRVTTAGVR